MKRVVGRVAAILSMVVVLTAIGSLPAGAHCQRCNYDNGPDNPHCATFVIGYADCEIVRDDCWWWIFFCDYKCEVSGECREWPG